MSIITNKNSNTVYCLIKKSEETQQDWDPPYFLQTRRNKICEGQLVLVEE
jgi:hypothetical protein